MGYFKVCRRHPIAYAILKAVDTTIDLQLNCLAGSINFDTKGKTGIACKIEMELN